MKKIFAQDNMKENERYDSQHPELEKEGRYTSPASSLPLYELKMLQEYIHGVNLQNLGSSLPHRKKQMMLMKFFKFKKNQRVEVFSRNGEEVIHTIGKVSAIGRDFVMIQTLLNRNWIPFHAIHSAKTPFGIPDLSYSHQHVIVDEELRRKLLTNFGEVVSGKETLKQQFFEESLETNLKIWTGTILTIFSNSTKSIGMLREIHGGMITIKNKNVEEILTMKVSFIKQNRFSSFIRKVSFKFMKRN